MSRRKKISSIEQDEIDRLQLDNESLKQQNKEMYRQLVIFVTTGKIPMIQPMSARVSPLKITSPPPARVTPEREEQEMLSVVESMTLSPKTSPEEEQIIAEALDIIQNKDTIPVDKVAEVVEAIEVIKPLSPNPSQLSRITSTLKSILVDSLDSFRRVMSGMEGIYESELSNPEEEVMEEAVQLLTTDVIRPDTPKKAQELIDKVDTLIPISDNQEELALLKVGLSNMLDDLESTMGTIGMEKTPSPRTSPMLATVEKKPTPYRMTPRSKLTPEREEEAILSAIDKQKLGESLSEMESTMSSLPKSPKKKTPPPNFLSRMIEAGKQFASQLYPGTPSPARVSMVIKKIKSPSIKAELEQATDGDKSIVVEELVTKGAQDLIDNVSTGVIMYNSPEKLKQLLDTSNDIIRDLKTIKPISPNKENIDELESKVVSTLMTMYHSAKGQSPKREITPANERKALDNAVAMIDFLKSLKLKDVVDEDIKNANLAYDRLDIIRDDSSNKERIDAVMNELFSVMMDKFKGTKSQYNPLVDIFSTVMDKVSSGVSIMEEFTQQLNPSMVQSPYRMSPQREEEAILYTVEKTPSPKRVPPKLDSPKTPVLYNELLQTSKSPTLISKLSKMVDMVAGYGSPVSTTEVEDVVIDDANKQIAIIDKELTKYKMTPKMMDQVIDMVLTKADVVYKDLQTTKATSPNKEKIQKEETKLLKMIMYATHMYNKAKGYITGKSVETEDELISRARDMIDRLESTKVTDRDMKESKEIYDKLDNIRDTSSKKQTIDSLLLKLFTLRTELAYEKNPDSNLFSSVFQAALTMVEDISEVAQSVSGYQSSPLSITELQQSPMVPVDTTKSKVVPVMVEFNPYKQESMEDFMDTFVKPQSTLMDINKNKSSAKVIDDAKKQIDKLDKSKDPMDRLLDESHMLYQELEQVKKHITDKKTLSNIESIQDKLLTKIMKIVSKSRVPSPMLVKELKLSPRSIDKITRRGEMIVNRLRNTTLSKMNQSDIRDAADVVKSLSDAEKFVTKDKKNYIDDLKFEIVKLVTLLDGQLEFDVGTTFNPPLLIADSPVTKMSSPSSPYYQSPMSDYGSPSNKSVWTTFWNALTTMDRYIPDSFGTQY